MGRSKLFRKLWCFLYEVIFWHFLVPKFLELSQKTWLFHAASVRIRCEHLYSSGKPNSMLFGFFYLISYPNLPPRNLRNIEEIKCHETWLILLHFSKKNFQRVFCWSPGNSHNLARNWPNVVGFVQAFSVTQSLLAVEVAGTILCPYALPQVLGEYLKLLRRRVEALFSYSFVLEIFVIFLLSWYTYWLNGWANKI